MIIVSVVGLKKTGKTTVVEALVAEFKARGMSVAAVKCMPHGNFSVHPEGKDTRRHAEAGADVVIAASQGELTVVRRVERFPSLGDIIEAAGPDPDVMICEGLPWDGADVQTVLAADGTDLAELNEVRGERLNVVAVSGIVSNAASRIEGLDVPVVNVLVRGGAAELADVLMACSGDR